MRAILATRNLSGPVIDGIEGHGRPASVLRPHGGGGAGGRGGRGGGGLGLGFGGWANFTAEFLIASPMTVGGDGAGAATLNKSPSQTGGAGQG
jgi:hypothetical protein